VTARVQLLEVDDVLAAAIRGTEPFPIPAAEGFPREEDVQGLHAYDVGSPAYVVVEDGVLVGTCGTHGPPDAAGTIELGWGLVEGARGRGIGTTTVAALLDGVRRRYPGVVLIARTEWLADGSGVVAESPASEAILHRLGFVSSAQPDAPGYRDWRLAG
jgi:RimJ/RimL family protein N-acetyltransferase